MADLVNAMNAGQVGALLIYGANPAYDYFRWQCQSIYRWIEESEAECFIVRQDG